MPAPVPPELPISAYAGEIVSLLKSGRVLVVCGDTGSGKTTQLPKFAVAAGCCEGGGIVACTQPRRIAAVSVAGRVAAELGSPVGGIVGYRHRYEKKVSPETKIEFMTDGVLLAETRHDPLLRRYGAIIIDEAHERTLNIDFLLGILKRILEKRRDLRVVVSSATLDSGRFSAFFGGARVVSVPGRMYPVETIYMPPLDGEERDLPRDVAAAVATLPPDDDVLVFLPGERDIRETASLLSRDPRFARDETVPLLASLPSAELARAFTTLPRRRIVLATNVAETSLTIPGIKAVVDSGLARIPRYIHRSNVQRLQIEPVSQASARQRLGRCGRIAPGRCIRLYSEEDYASREPYTPPEILRSSLAGVILTMLDLRLGKIEEFPFIDPPRPVMVRQGLKELLELGAIGREERRGAPVLTPVGRRLAAMPLEPRLARMLVAASALATLPSALPVVAAMGCDDPRRRPVDEREKAAQAHAQFRVKDSDFLGILKLWRWWDAQCEALSQTQLRKLAKKNYLSYPKLREWRELVRQLGALARRMGLDAENDNGGPDALHRALLSGLLGRIGRLDHEELDYRGAHALRFAVHPSSVLKKSHPEWIVAGELVETARLYARTVAVVDPRWIVAAAGDIAKRSWRDPAWDPATGFVRAIERVTLYGLVIADGQRRDYGGIDPAAAREIFIFHALVLGEYPHPPRIVRENLSVIAEIRRRAERLRRPELAALDRLSAHFASCVPEDVNSCPALGKWLYRAGKHELDAFRLDRDEWLSETGAAATGFPSRIKIAGADLKLSYRHLPDDRERDGITCTVAKRDAAILKLWRADWLVPGALPEKAAFLLSSLPGRERRLLEPLSDTLAIIMPMLKPDARPFVDALSAAIKTRFGIRISVEALASVKLSPHLQMRFRIVSDEDGRELSASRDLGEALEKAGVSSGGGVSTPLADTSKHVLWDFPPAHFASLREQSRQASREGPQQVFRALHDEGDGVSVRLFNEREAALASHVRGVSRLMCLALEKKLRPTFSMRGKPVSAVLYFKTLNYPAERISTDILYSAIFASLAQGRPPRGAVADKAEFETLLEESIGGIAAESAKTARMLEDVVALAGECRDRMASLSEDISGDMTVQMAWLLFPGFARSVPPRALASYQRYFKALSTRIDRAKHNPSGDRSKMARFEPYWEQYRAAVAEKGGGGKNRKALERYRWLLEEYRISLFAQEVKTSEPVSPERLSALWLEAVPGR